MRVGGVCVGGGGTVLQSDYTASLGRLMKFPPVENVLWLLERALQIRDLPMDRKPIPLNGPQSTRTAGAAPAPRTDWGRKASVGYRGCALTMFGAARSGAVTRPGPGKQAKSQPPQYGKVCFRGRPWAWPDGGHEVHKGPHNVTDPCGVLSVGAAWPLCSNRRRKAPSRARRVLPPRCRVCAVRPHPR